MIWRRISSVIFLLIFLAALSSGEERRISMRFKEASLDYVLEFFSKATGYTVIKDADLKARVTVISPDEMPVEEAIKVLNSILAYKGYTATVNGKVLKVIPLESAKTEFIPVRTGSDPERIEADDTIVTQVMPLAYADAAQVQKVLKDLVPKFGIIAAYPQSNTLIVTATSANVKRLAEIIKQLDIPISEFIKVEVFHLQYADATQLAEVIRKLFEKPATSATSQQQRFPPRGRFGFPPGREEQRSQQETETPSGEGLLQLMGEVKAVADKNTNTLVVSASEGNLKIIRDLVQKLDRKLFSEPVTRIFTLKYADATEVANELNQAFSRTARSTFIPTGFGFGRFFGRGTSQTQAGQGGTGETGVLGLPEVVAVPDVRTNSVIVTTTEQQMESIAKLIEQLDRDISDYVEDTRAFRLEYADASNVASVLNELFSTSLFERQRATRAISTVTGTRTSSAQGGVLGTAARNVEEARGLTGNVKIVAEETTNTLLITTYAKNFPIIERIIKELDVPLPQVLIEAQIIEVTLDDESLFGVEWIWQKERKVAIDGKEYDLSADLSFGLSDESFGLKYGILSTNLEAFLSSLAKNTKVNILSTPHIMTQNNQEAVINVGQEVPYLRSTQETATGGILTSYDYKDVGVILTVTPRVNKSGTVSLEVNQQINSLIEFTLFNAPVIAKREATASVTVKDGQTIVIGGIMKDNKTKTVRKVPILGDIPFIGQLFKREDVRSEKTELMVFITPHVVYTEEDARRVTEEQKGKLKINKLNNPKGEQEVL